MKFNHIVNYNGVYYAAGEEVPIDDNSATKEETVESVGETSTHQYTAEELEEIPVRKIREIAAERGFDISATIKADVINEFLIKQ